MLKKMLASLVAFALAPSVVLAGPTCTGDAPMKPMWEVAKSYEEKGGKIKLMKETKDGCFEIYGIEKDDTKVEIYFDPRTGEELERHTS